MNSINPGIYSPPPLCLPLQAGGDVRRQEDRGGEISAKVLQFNKSAFKGFIIDYHLFFLCCDTSTTLQKNL